MSALINAQKIICLKYGAEFVRCDDDLRVGIMKNFNRHQFPINGLRHPPEGITTGWYVWSGETFSEDVDFFASMCSVHLQDKCPEIVKYLGLGPGWRFLYAPGYEDVWYDRKLLDV